LTEIAVMNDEEVSAALARRPVLILPIGAVESHGNHLPAGTDNRLAERMAIALVERVAGVVPVLRLPVLPFGQVWSLEHAPGSFGISAQTVTRALVEIGASARAKGLSTLIVVNAHLGNAAAIRDAQRETAPSGLVMASFFYPGMEVLAREMRTAPEARQGYMHACEIETSFALHLAPEIVRMDRAIANYPQFPDDFDLVPYRWTEFSESPVLGDARAARAETGKGILDPVLDRMAEATIALFERQA
jgi:creatinine amidohydrolase